MSNQTNPDAGAFLELGKAIVFRGAVAYTKIRDTSLGLHAVAYSQGLLLIINRFK